MIEEEKINSCWLKRYTSHFVLAVLVITKLRSSQYVYGAITKQAGVQPSRMLISSVLSIWKGQMRTAAANSNPG